MLIIESINETRNYTSKDDEKKRKSTSHKIEKAHQVKIKQTYQGWIPRETR